MTTQVTINLSDEDSQRIGDVAQQQGLSVDSVLAITLKPALELLQHMSTMPVESLSDAELLQAADSQMDPQQNTRMSALLSRQQSGQLSHTENYELAMLLQIYDRGSARKVQALAEAVRRGLREAPKA